jgi:predicted alpha-1,2-mannosidase
MTLDSRLSKLLLAALLSTALTFAAIAASGIGSAAAAEAGVTAAEAYEAVEPMIGTGFDTTQNKGNSAYGNTWPGAAMPFGMTQFTPTTHGTRRNPDSGGYEYAADEIRGFGMTRLSGTGCEGTNSAFDIPLLPYTAALSGAGGPANSPGLNITSDYLKFSHADEESAPGFYKVGLEDGVEAQLGATLRTTVGQFKYPTTGPAALLVNASGSNNDAGETKVVVDPADQTISGYTTSQTVCAGGTYRIYFSSKFDTPFASHGTWTGDNVNAEAEEAASSAGANQTGAYVSFAPGSTVTVRTGISYVSVEGAEENREAEADGKSFAEVVAAARTAWEEDLGTVSIATPNAEERTIFYTALYHALLQPNVYDDVDGKYRAFSAGTTMSSQVKELASGQEHEYVTYSGWDQYRGQSQLIALLFPKVGSDIAQSITDLATQTGKWFNWPHLGSGQNKQNGDALQTMIASYSAFGDTGFDRQSALESMVKDESLPGTGSTRTALLSEIAVGFIEDRTENSTSTTLDYAVADFGIAQFAAELGDTAAAAAFMTRAQHWQNLVSSEAQAIVPRDRSGFWSGFNLNDRSFEGAKVNSGANNNQFDQSTGAQYQWSVPFDVTRLIEKLGGQAKAREKLNTLMVNLDESGVSGSGNYLSNEPAFITPWIYSWLEEPDKTTATLDRVRHQMFDTTPEGLAGNDDLGSLSSYYVWSALGLYPAIYGRSELLEAAPAFESVQIEALGGGRSITISAPGASTKRDVTGTKVNGTTSMKSWLPESFAQQGGTIEYTLAEAPGSWGVGAANVPPSFDQGTNGYNGIATSKDGQTNAGSLDFSGNSLSREKLAAEGIEPGQPVPYPVNVPSSYEGLTFIWPNTQPGEFDSWIPHGQEVDLGGVRASKISFLGLATNGPCSGTAKVVYTDGTSQQVAVGFTDWTTGAPSFGNFEVASVSGRNGSGGTSDTTVARIFATEPSTLDKAKFVEKVYLPENVPTGIQHIFAVATNELSVPTASVVGPTTVTAGEEFAVRGSEYTPNEAVDLELEGGSGTVATGSAQADGSGDLDATLTVPGRVPTGGYELTVTGVESGFPISAAVTVDGFAPAITATSSVETGAEVEVEGAGYAPEETVTLTFAGKAGMVEADEGGEWSATLAAPATAGTYPVEAVGSVSELTETQSVMVSAPGSNPGGGNTGRGGNTGTGTTTTEVPNTGTTTTSPGGPTNPGGPLKKASKAKTTTTLKAAKAGRKVAIEVKVTPSSATGRVILRDGSKTLRTLTLKKGEASMTLDLAPGSHKLSAEYRGSAEAAASRSKTVKLVVR